MEDFNPDAELAKVKNDLASINNVFFEKPKEQTPPEMMREMVRLKEVVKANETSTEAAKAELQKLSTKFQDYVVKEGMAGTKFDIEGALLSLTSKIYAGPIDGDVDGLIEGMRQSAKEYPLLLEMISHTIVMDEVMFLELKKIARRSKLLAAFLDNCKDKVEFNRDALTEFVNELDNDLATDDKLLPAPMVGKCSLAPIYRVNITLPTTRRRLKKEGA